MRLYDAHNHLQDDRLASYCESAVATCARIGLAKMVVNGSSEDDWPQVESLARAYPQVIPSFGYHPWYVRERSPRWQQRLVEFLDRNAAAVGEIGLDRWIKDHDLPRQEEAFTWQLRLAAERDLPVSIHCLQAWGRLLQLLENNPRPTRGFVLHSFGGPPEMIVPLARLGAYFSLPGYFAHERKARQRETFKHVPPDRLLIETDAPDQLLPDDRNEFPLTETDGGKPLNHPANILAVYRFAGELLGQSLEVVAGRVEENFLRLFGPLANSAAGGMAKPQ